MQGTYTKRSTDDVYDISEGALPYRLQRIAEDELGETPARRKESLEKLAKLMSEEQELNARKDAEFLLRFLRMKKYNVEAAMQTIRNYYYNRSACDAVYHEFFPSSLPPCARKIVTVLPFKDRQGRQIILCNMEYMMLDPSAQTLGVVSLVNCQDFVVENAMALKPGILKRGLEYVQDCMPSRMKAFHVLRQGRAFDIMYALMKPFLKNKMTQRFKLHGENMESLHKEISAEELPPQFGGKAPPLDYDAFWSKMDELEDDFKRDNSYGYPKSYAGDFASQEEIDRALEFL